MGKGFKGRKDCQNKTATSNLDGAAVPNNLPHKTLVLGRWPDRGLSEQGFCEQIGLVTKEVL